MTVLHELKPRLDEKLYENALVLDLRAQGHRVDQQKQFPVFYRGVEIAKGLPGLIVGRAVSAAHKMVTTFNDTHMAQMVGHLHITGLELTILLNFKHAPLQWKRVVREKDHR